MRTRSGRSKCLARMPRAASSTCRNSSRRQAGARGFPRRKTTTACTAPPRRAWACCTASCTASRKCSPRSTRSAPSRTQASCCAWAITRPPGSTAGTRSTRRPLRRSSTRRAISPRTYTSTSSPTSTGAPPVLRPCHLCHTAISAPLKLPPCTHRRTIVVLQTAGEQGYCSMGGSASPFLLATAYPPGWGQGGHGWPVTAEKVVCVDKLRALLLTGDAYGTVICVHLARGHFSPMLRPELVSLLHKPPLGAGRALGAARRAASGRGGQGDEAEEAAVRR